MCLQRAGRSHVEQVSRLRRIRNADGTLLADVAPRFSPAYICISTRVWAAQGLRFDRCHAPQRVRFCADAQDDWLAPPWGASPLFGATLV